MTFGMLPRHDSPPTIQAAVGNRNKAKKPLKNGLCLLRMLELFHPLAPFLQDAMTITGKMAAWARWGKVVLRCRIRYYSIMVRPTGWDTGAPEKTVAHSSCEERRCGVMRTTWGIPRLVRGRWRVGIVDKSLSGGFHGRVSRLRIGCCEQSHQL